MFVKHGCPRRQPSQNMAKISKSYIMTPPHPLGHVISVKCEEPLNELTVKVWLLLDFVCKRDGITDRQTDKRTNRQTDGQTIRLLDAPGGPFIKTSLLSLAHTVIFILCSKDAFEFDTSECITFVLSTVCTFYLVHINSRTYTPSIALFFCLY